MIISLYFFFNRTREWSGLDPGPDLGPALRERLHIVRIEGFQAFGNAAVEPVAGQELPIGLRRGGKTARDQNSRLGQAAHHLAQRSILAPDLVQVGHPQVLQPSYVHDLAPSWLLHTGKVPILTLRSTSCPTPTRS